MRTRRRWRRWWRRSLRLRLEGLVVFFGFWLEEGREVGVEMGKGRCT